jgi:hypothetical protein
VGVLTGWKEIADHLHLTVRTAQRWEPLGLPVRRVSASRRSPVVAISDEIEQWARKKEIKARRLKSAASAGWVEVSSTQDAGQRRARKLVEEVCALAIEQKRLLGLIRSGLKR